MRNIPLKAFAKRSPIKTGKKSMEGFMHPPYKKPVGPTEKPHYVHGYKNQEAKEDAQGVTTNIKIPKVFKDGSKNRVHFHKKNK